ncbi:MAG TPA: hypothetical protein VF329_04240 [Gammaproteobacteria bacterium]
MNELAALARSTAAEWRALRQRCPFPPDIDAALVELIDAAERLAALAESAHEHETVAGAAAGALTTANER